MKKFRINHIGVGSLEFDDAIDAKAYIQAHPELFPRGKRVTVVGPSNGNPDVPDEFPFIPKK